MFCFMNWHLLDPDLFDHMAGGSSGDIKDVSKLEGK